MSRSQTSIALSSCESEYLSSVGGAAEFLDTHGGGNFGGNRFFIVQSFVSATRRWEIETRRYPIFVVTAGGEEADLEDGRSSDTP